MTSDKIVVRFPMHASAREIYDAWLDSARHSAMTASPAKASREVGGEFSAWDGYITGKNLLLIENKKIVQSWRASDFPEDAPDSVLSVQLIERQGITEIEIEHSDIPAGLGPQYHSGWMEFYAEPMRKYFTAKLSPDKGRQSAGKKTAAAKKPAKKKSVPKKTAVKKAKPKKKVAAAKRSVTKTRKKGK